MTTTAPAHPIPVSSSAAESLPDASQAANPSDRSRPANLGPGQSGGEAHHAAAGVSLPDASSRANSKIASRPANLDPGQMAGEDHEDAAGVDLRDDHETRETHRRAVVSDPCVDQEGIDAQAPDVGAELNGRHVAIDAQCLRASVELLFCAAFLDDCERIRIATDNRLRSMRETGLDVRVYEQQADALAKLEHQAELELKRVMRRHPLGAWVKRTVGLGEKQTARLIASIGDIAYNHLADRPRRGPAELWAYCGYVPGQRRRKGEKANWNAEAKMRVYLCAESCIKQRESPYRATYDTARVKHVDAIHDHPCARCGPAGRPAPTGSPLSDGHKHARALREVAKAILRDLFLEARRVDGLELDFPTVGGSSGNSTADSREQNCPLSSRRSGGEPPSLPDHPSEEPDIPEWLRYQRQRARINHQTRYQGD